MADIYINSDESSLALCRESRDELEDDLDEFFGSAGQTCGGGAALGSAAWNVDVQVTDEDNLPLWVERLCGFLRGWGVPRDTELVVLPSGWVEGMESQRVPVFPVAAPSRETFAADPAGQLWAEGVQPEWVADAYSADEGFRAAAAEALAESVRKRGDLGLVGGWSPYCPPRSAARKRPTCSAGLRPTRIARMASGEGSFGSCSQHMTPAKVAPPNHPLDLTAGACNPS